MLFWSNIFCKNIDYTYDTTCIFVSHHMEWSTKHKKQEFQYLIFCTVNAPAQLSSNLSIKHPCFPSPPHDQPMTLCTPHCTPSNPRIEPRVKWSYDSCKLKYKKLSTCIMLIFLRRYLRWSLPWRYHSLLACILAGPRACSLLVPCHLRFHPCVCRDVDVRPMLRYGEIGELVPNQVLMSPLHKIAVKNERKRFAMNNTCYKLLKYRTWATCTPEYIGCDTPPVQRNPCGQ